MPARSRRRRRGRHEAEHENEERWLLTYADMITLLMALFMVLFSMSSVNVSKFESLQRALQEAFSGKILPGGTSIQHTGASQDPEPAPPEAEPPVPAIQPTVGREERSHDDDEFAALKRKVEAYAAAHGLQGKLQARIARRGLVIRLLTDRVLFDSGQATLRSSARPILAHIARLLRTHVRRRQTVVEGHTDNVPIRGGRFPTNWELSTARATTVVRFLISKGVEGRKLTAAGRAQLRPIASNRTASGRYRNRRVEIAVLRGTKETT